jgi:hypothetical protein
MTGRIAGAALDDIHHPVSAPAWCESIVSARS